MYLSDKTVNITAFVLLTIMFATGFLSMKNDALTFDELAHIPAGYSYLTKQDYRINPEHPPLVKDIPALPLLFLNLNFPDHSQNWLQEHSSPAWWVQFDLGTEFIYRSGNNPNEIISWSRAMMIILLVFVGWLLFWWTKKLTNNIAALGALLLFTFSPTFLAHGRLVNTDVGAVLGSLLAIMFWLKFLEKPLAKNILFAGLAFGTAMLLKFSLVLLIPFFVIITLFYSFLFFKNLWSYIAKSLISSLIGFLFVVWPVYQFHVQNYPPEQQLRDTIADISGHPIAPAKDLTILMTESRIFRAPAQYFRGLLMASQRTVWGNTTYFLGEISAQSWWHYFPLLFLLKEPLALHALWLMAVVFLIIWLLKIKTKQEFIDFIRNNFQLVALFFWIAVYWMAAIAGNLNIGVRHLLPIFPFTYILVVFGIYQGIKIIKNENAKTTLKIMALSLFLWYAVSSLLAFPHYLSYYNALGGGTKQGYKIAVDSNYDWGQDFYRLAEFIERENIDKIYVDYFGGEDEEYWLGEKYIKLNPKEILEPPKGWLAVSVNHIMGGQAKPASGFDQETGYYDWLTDYTPIARAGRSIFIYKIE